MKLREATGIGLLFIVGLLGAFILTFILLLALPTHPGSEEHGAIMSYLIFGGDISFLTVDEQEHMRDVRVLVNSLLVVFLITGALATSMFRVRRRFAGYGLLLVVAFFAGVSLRGFSNAWVRFHHVFFPQGGWQFPVESTLITLYPESYFLGAVLVFTGFVIMIATGLIYDWQKIRS